MGTNYNPTIITDGLVMALDAANPKSYIGSGTAWNDLSANGNNGILTNSPTFSSSNNGFFTFNGSTQYVDSGTNNNLVPTVGLTVCAWAKTTVADKFLVDRENAGLTAGYWFAGTSSAKFQFAVNSSATQVTSLTSITTGNWLYMVGTWVPSVSIIVYLNGVFEAQNTTSIPSSIIDPAVNVWIARRRNGADLWNGNIASVIIYNRALSASEVYQNFAAMRGRYSV
jgi:hypothetical protein